MSVGYEWVTKFVIRHHAGSVEGAIHQRNAMDHALRGFDAVVVMASTEPGDAAEAGWREFQDRDEAS